MRVDRRAGQGKDRAESAVDVAVVVAPWHEGHEQQPHAAGPYHLVVAEGTEFMAKYIFNGTPFYFLFAGTA